VRQDAGGVGTGEADIPFDSLDQSAVREVGGADEGSREPALSVKEPRFGVEAGPRRRRIVRDADLGAQLLQPVESLPLRSAHVGGGQHPETTAPSGEGLQRRFEQADSVDVDERAEEVDAVGRGELSQELLRKSWLAGLVHEQRAFGKRH
jgi:hypothetical protein